MHVMTRQVVVLFGAYQSRNNARQCFWNGSPPPIGHRIVAAGQCGGAKVKNKLEIHPLQVDTIWLPHRLALEGDGVSGSMDIGRHLGRKAGHPRRSQFCSDLNWRATPDDDEDYVCAIAL